MKLIKPEPGHIERREKRNYNLFYFQQESGCSVVVGVVSPFLRIWNKPNSLPPVEMDSNFARVNGVVRWWSDFQIVWHSKIKMIKIHWIKIIKYQQLYLPPRKTSSHGSRGSRRTAGLIRVPNCGCLFFRSTRQIACSVNPMKL